MKIAVKFSPACEGEASNISVFVDNHLVGIMEPGEPELSVEVAKGKHLIYCRSREGRTWSYRVQDGNILIGFS
jgi:hypothetical protein